MEWWLVKWGKCLFARIHKRRIIHERTFPEDSRSHQQTGGCGNNQPGQMRGGDAGRLFNYVHSCLCIFMIGSMSTFGKQTWGKMFKLHHWDGWHPIWLHDKLVGSYLLLGLRVDARHYF
jgi:hypothetical protein